MESRYWIFKRANEMQTEAWSEACDSEWVMNGLYNG